MRTPEQAGLVDGCWSDRRCIVVGGGLSLKGFDWSTLKNERWIGTNRAWIHNPTIGLVLDRRYQYELGKDPAWLAWDGLKMWHRPRGNLKYLPPIPEEVVVLTSTGKYNPCRSLNDGLFYGNNAGASAISLASLLAGPTGTVYLLGFDLCGLGGMSVNWHNDYPDKWKSNDSVYARYRRDIEILAGQITTRVYNVSPGKVTSLKCWPIIDKLPEKDVERKTTV